MGKLLCFILHFLEFSKLPNLTGRDSSVKEVIRTLSRIDRAFPMAEARDFHCYSHDFENLVAVRVVIEKSTIRGHQGKRIPSWMSKHPVFCSILKRLNEKARKRTVRELSRKTPDSLGAKLLTASTALRA